MPWNQIETAVAAKFECIGKGKARKPYEFGVKSAVVVAHHHGLMLGALVDVNYLDRSATTILAGGSGE